MITAEPIAVMKASCIHCQQPFGDPERGLTFLHWLGVIKTHLRDRHQIFLTPEVAVNTHLVFTYGTERMNP